MSEESELLEYDCPVCTYKKKCPRDYDSTSHCIQYLTMIYEKAVNRNVPRRK